MKKKFLLMGTDVRQQYLKEMLDSRDTYKNGFRHDTG